MKNKLIRNVVGKRLAYYKDSADAGYWDEFWQKHLNKKWFSRYDQGNLLFFEDVFLKYLPRSGRILEAGCGPGQIVMALRYRGYNCEGVEWAQQTVDTVKQLFPDLPIRSGDVTALNVPDGYYAACISLGVVEHRFTGPEPYLKESRRMLREDGVLLVSVPFFNPLRQWKFKRGAYQDAADEQSFFQYAYGIDEMVSILNIEGFRVAEVYPYDLFLGLKEEIPALAPILNIPHMSFLLNTLFIKWQWGRQHLSHMVLFACRKEQDETVPSLI